MDSLSQQVDERSKSYGSWHPQFYLLLIISLKLFSFFFFFPSPSSIALSILLQLCKEDTKIRFPCFIRCNLFFCSFITSVLESDVFFILNRRRKEGQAFFLFFFQCFRFFNGKRTKLRDSGMEYFYKISRIYLFFDFLVSFPPSENKSL